MPTCPEHPHTTGAPCPVCPIEAADLALDALIARFDLERARLDLAEYWARQAYRAVEVDLLGPTQ